MVNTGEASMFAAQAGWALTPGEKFSLSLVPGSPLSCTPMTRKLPTGQLFWLTRAPLDCVILLMTYAAVPSTNRQAGTPATEVPSGYEMVKLPLSPAGVSLAFTCAVGLPN